MTRPNQLTDSTGLYSIRQGSHVMVIRNNHQRRGQTGTVIRVADGRVWVAFPDGNVVPAGHRSVRVIVPKPADRI